ncbi:alpha/beta hydrolase [Bacillus sp. FJAT-49705]|uniref:Alpha/beta hydrolase n=1 Tax=Cytobacillus citreus TaxID=2833586 RepID=A0ABS5NY97_9BACI|nr:alpha/beta hydrolase [Cytobacillus citreus]MBS4192812.1 alpha/beta hydrolase [Cytobacillus citreus]
MLDPQAKTFLNLLGEREPTSTMTPEQNRVRAAELRKLAGPGEPVAKVEEFFIPVKNGEIKVRVYTPEGEGLFPIFIYLHGGGWVFGDLDTADSPCRSLTNQAECIVVSVDYRLSPEYKFPTPLEDCYAAATWVAAHAREWNGDPTRIAIGGDSAGGNLAATVSLMAKNQDGPTFIAQVLIYPVTDLSFSTSSYETNGEGYFLTRDSMEWFTSQYLNEEEDKFNFYAAPLQAKDLSQLPPAFVITAEYDPLCDEGLAYADRLRQAGVQVEYICYEGMIHGFFWMAGIMDKGKMAIDQVARYLHSAFYHTVYPNGDLKGGIKK